MAFMSLSLKVPAAEITPKKRIRAIGNVQSQHCAARYAHSLQ